MRNIQGNFDRYKPYILACTQAYSSSFQRPDFHGKIGTPHQHSYNLLTLSHIVNSMAKARKLCSSKLYSTIMTMVMINKQGVKKCRPTCNEIIPIMAMAIAADFQITSNSSSFKCAKNFTCFPSKSSTN